jgi:hypothetical protein
LRRFTDTAKHADFTITRSGLVRERRYHDHLNEGFLFAKGISAPGEALRMWKPVAFCQKMNFNGFNTEEVS